MGAKGDQKEVGKGLGGYFTIDMRLERTLIHPCLSDIELTSVLGSLR